MELTLKILDDTKLKFGNGSDSFIVHDNANTYGYGAGATLWRQASDNAAKPLVIEAFQDIFMNFEADNDTSGEFIIGYAANGGAGHEDILKMDKDGVTFEGAANAINPVAGTPGIAATVDYVESIAYLICDPGFGVTCPTGQPFIVDVIANMRQLVFTKGILTSNP